MSMRSAPPLDPSRPVVIPGEPEAQIEQARRAAGIPMSEDTFELLKGLAHGQYEYEVPNI
jgi:LDH2 family malate/lactate/ureidoglycolate dehydrogenase